VKEASQHRAVVQPAEQADGRARDRMPFPAGVFAGERVTRLWLIRNGVSSG
jgi:hypothetical protein